MARPRTRGPSFFQRMANPLVRAVLRSPLSPMLGRSLMLITLTGRKTGREYTIPVQYASAGDALWVNPGDSAHKTWWRNLRDPAAVRLRLRGDDVDAIACVLDGSMDPEARAEGLRVFLRRFPAARRAYGVHVNADDTLDDESLRAAVGRIVMVRITQLVEATNP